MSRLHSAGRTTPPVGGMWPGTVIAVELRRGKDPLTLKVKLGVRPPDFTPTPTRIPPPPIDP